VTVGRAAGLREVLGTEDYQVKAVNGDWTEKGGARAMVSWLRLKSVELSRSDIVVGQNDSMALGAQRVAEEQRREWSRVPFLGCDGLPEGGSPPPSPFPRTPGRRWNWWRPGWRTGSRFRPRSF
jgi:ABC-type sugar transport system substrate-binding protein